MKKNRLFLTIVFISLLFLFPSCQTKEKDKTSFNANQELQMVVGYKMGGKADSVARLIATAVENHIDSSVVIRNIAGNFGRDGLDYTFARPSDGYTVVYTNTLDGIWTHSFLNSYERAWELDDWKTLGIYAELSDMGLATSMQSPLEDFAQFIEEARKKPGELLVGSLGPGRFDDLWMIELQEFFHVTFNWKLYDDSLALQKDIEEGSVDAGIIQTQTEELSRNNGIRVLTVIGSELPEGFPIEVPTLKDFEEDLHFDVRNLRALTMPTLATILVKADVPHSTYEELVQLMATIFKDEEWREVMPMYAWPTYYSPQEAEHLYDEVSAILMDYKPLHEQYIGTGMVR